MSKRRPATQSCSRATNLSCKHYKALLHQQPPAMCRSKEAWEHFIFVPCLPKSRVTRAAKRRLLDAFRFLLAGLRVLDSSFEVLIADQDWFLQCNTVSCRSSVQSVQKPSSSSYSFEDAALAVGLTAGLGAAAASTALAPLAPGAALLKVAMMVPTPPPPSLAPPAPPLAAATQGRTNALLPEQPRPTPQFSLLDTLLPNFNTDTFIWRVSMLQITEYIGSLLLGSAYGSPKLCSLYLLGASWGPAIAQGAVWRLMLPMMLHANALHIFFNLFFQMRIGFGMEKQFGRRKFCLLYMFCGFLGNLISVAVDPMKLAVGASTSGFGLLGVWAAEVLLTWDLLGESRSRVFLWFAFMVISCIMMSTISPNVDFVGHFAGMLAGFLLAIILADMQEEHQPPWYDKAKLTAKNITALIVIASLVRAITLGPDGPIPYCGTIFHPRRLPF